MNAYFCMINQEYSEYSFAINHFVFDTITLHKLSDLNNSSSSEKQSLKNQCPPN